MLYFNKLQLHICSYAPCLSLLALADGACQGALFKRLQLRHMSNMSTVSAHMDLLCQRELVMMAPVLNGQAGWQGAC